MNNYCFVSVMDLFFLKIFLPLFNSSSPDYVACVLTIRLTGTTGMMDGISVLFNGRQSFWKIAIKEK